MRLLGYLPGHPVIGFYGMFERNFGCPDTPEPLSLVVPSSEGGTILPFSCPRCAESIDFRSPGRRDCFHDTRQGVDEGGRRVVRDNYHCPCCGWRFRLDLRGKPLRHPVYGAVAPAWVESPDGSSRSLDAPTIVGNFTSRCAYAAHVIGAGLIAARQPAIASRGPSQQQVAVTRVLAPARMTTSRPWSPPQAMRAGVPLAVLPFRGGGASTSLPSTSRPKRLPVTRHKRGKDPAAARARLLATAQKLKQSSQTLGGKSTTAAARSAGSPGVQRVAARGSHIASKLGSVAGRLLRLASSASTRSKVPAYVRGARVVAGVDDAGVISAAQAAYDDALAAAEAVKADLQAALVRRDRASSNAPDLDDPGFAAWLARAEDAETDYRAAMETAAALVFQDTSLADARDALDAARAYVAAEGGGAGGGGAGGGGDGGGAGGGGGGGDGGAGDGGGGAGSGENGHESDDTVSSPGEQPTEPPSYRGDDVPTDRLPDPEELIEDDELIEDFVPVDDDDVDVEDLLDDGEEGGL